MKDTISPWISSNHKNRAFSIKITRLRIGHTLFSHRHLMEGEIAPVCQFCADVTLTVQHVIAVCPQFSNSRERFFPTTVTTNDPDMIMREILAEKEDASY